MPAFGKNGIVNINQNEPQTVWQLVKPDGTVVKSGTQAEIESSKQSLSQQLNCELTVKTSTMRCL
jgi:hypothetical protein